MKLSKAEKLVLNGCLGIKSERLLGAWSTPWQRRELSLVPDHFRQLSEQASCLVDVLNEMPEI